jgi:hypothetical protein
VIFPRTSFLGRVDRRTLRFASKAELESHACSDSAGMLLILTVSDREIIVIVHVALSSGSSQQGKAARASVGYKG